jgi:hypothetical protein
LLLYLIANELRASDSDRNKINTDSDPNRKEVSEYRLVLS